MSDSPSTPPPPPPPPPPPNKGRPISGDYERDLSDHIRRKWLEKSPSNSWNAIFHMPPMPRRPRLSISGRIDAMFIRLAAVVILAVYLWLLIGVGLWVWSQV
jgi:hypothetical protein